MLTQQNYSRILLVLVFRDYSKREPVKPLHKSDRSKEIFRILRILCEMEKSNVIQSERKRKKKSKKHSKKVKKMKPSKHENNSDEADSSEDELQWVESTQSSCVPKREDWMMFQMSPSAGSLAELTRRKEVEDKKKDVMDVSIYALIVWCAYMHANVKIVPILGHTTCT